MIITEEVKVKFSKINCANNQNYNNCKCKIELKKDSSFEFHDLNNTYQPMKLFYENLIVQKLDKDECLIKDQYCPDKEVKLNFSSKETADQFIDKLKDLKEVFCSLNIESSESDDIDRKQRENNVKVSTPKKSKYHIIDEFDNIENTSKVIEEFYSVERTNESENCPADFHELTSDNIYNLLQSIRDVHRVMAVESNIDKNKFIHNIACFLNSKFLDSVWNLQRSAVDKDDETMIGAICEIVIKITTLGCKPFCKRNFSEAPIWLEKYFNLSSLEIPVIDNQDEDFQDESVYNDDDKVTVHNGIISPIEVIGKIDPFFSIPVDPLGILLTDKHFLGFLSVLGLLANKNERNKYVHFWVHEMQYLGNDLVRKCVFNIEDRRLFKLCATLISRLAFIKDVVLPCFLDDVVSHVSHQLIIGLSLLLLQIINNNGYETWYPYLKFDDNAIYMFLNTLRQVKNIPSYEIKNFFLPCLKPEFIEALLCYMNFLCGSDEEDEKISVPKKRIVRLSVCSSYINLNNSSEVLNFENQSTDNKVSNIPSSMINNFCNAIDKHKSYRRRLGTEFLILVSEICGSELQECIKKMPSLVVQFNKFIIDVFHESVEIDIVHNLSEIMKILMIGHPNLLIVKLFYIILNNEYEGKTQNLQNSSNHNYSNNQNWKFLEENSILSNNIDSNSQNILHSDNESPDDIRRIILKKKTILLTVLKEVISKNISKYAKYMNPHDLSYKLLKKAVEYYKCKSKYGNAATCSYFSQVLNWLSSIDFESTTISTNKKILVLLFDYLAEHLHLGGLLHGSINSLFEKLNKKFDFSAKVEEIILEGFALSSENIQKIINSSHWPIINALALKVNSRAEKISNINLIWSKDNDDKENENHAMINFKPHQMTLKSRYFSKNNYNITFNDLKNLDPRQQNRSDIDTIINYDKKFAEPNIRRKSIPYNMKTSNFPNQNSLDTFKSSENLRLDTYDSNVLKNFCDDSTLNFSLKNIFKPRKNRYSLDSVYKYRNSIG